MQKVFALLLTDLRRLGATIIFADFSKIVIDTGKFDLSAAKAYCDSLLTAVGNRLVSSLPNIYVYNLKLLWTLHIFLSLILNALSLTAISLSGSCSSRFTTGTHYSSWTRLDLLYFPLVSTISDCQTGQILFRTVNCEAVNKKLSLKHKK